MKRGFTIVEIVVVIVCMGVLTILALPRMTGMKDSAMAGEAVGVLAALRDAQKRYCFEHSDASGNCIYPPSDGTVAGNQAACRYYDLDYPILQYFDQPQCAGNFSGIEGRICASSKASTGLGWEIRVYPNDTWACPDTLAQCPPSVLKVIPH